VIIIDEQLALGQFSRFWNKTNFTARTFCLCKLKRLYGKDWKGILVELIILTSKRQGMHFCDGEWMGRNQVIDFHRIWFQDVKMLPYLIVGSIYYKLILE
jgi:hypothetical protein